MRTPALTTRLAAEAVGTFWLVFAGVGTAVFAAKFVAPNVVAGQSLQVGVGFLGVALAFGLAMMTMAYAVGYVSGAHFNPAVTVGVAVAKRFPWKDVPAYVITQVAAGLVAGLAVWGVARGAKGFDVIGNLGVNGYGDHSPGGYTLVAVLCAEAILTGMFVYVILGATDDRAPTGFAPIAIGLALTLAHLVALPISNAALNPARATAVAFFNGNGAPGQLWAFWVAPVVGAAIAGATYHLVTGVDRREGDIVGQVAPEDPRADA